VRNGRAGLKRSRSVHSSANNQLYRAAFIRNVHLLLYMGYVRLNLKSFHDADEPDISGALCKAIEEALDDPQSDGWVDDFEVHDDPPVHQEGRTGKRRRRVDIKLSSRIERPRLRFCFEAKRLGKHSGVDKYLGPDGLTRFLDGSYGAEHDSGGMLGYIQSDDCTLWADKLKRGIETVKHRLTNDGGWRRLKVCEQIKHTYRTKHVRHQRLGEIIIYHTLLAFDT